MDIKTASKLIEENLHTIFAWSLSKLYDKSEAEDLAQDIICAVLKSVHRLEKDEAFYGYMWRIAENTLRAKVRSVPKISALTKASAACAGIPPKMIL